MSRFRFVAGWFAVLALGEACGSSPSTDEGDAVADSTTGPSETSGDSTTSETATDVSHETSADSAKDWTPDSKTDSALESSVDSGVDSIVADSIASDAGDTTTIVDSGVLDVPTESSSDSGAGAGSDSAIDAGGGSDATDAAPSDSSAPFGGCEACPAGQKFCAVACVHTSDPNYGCGATTCSPCFAFTQHTTWMCAASACVVGSCESGWADCDGDLSNGCEADLSQQAHCGTCTNACGSAKCDAGTCVASCTPPKTNCSGACVDLTSSPSNCGGCGKVCAAGSHSTATCAAAACDQTCSAGYILCGSTCADTTSDPNNCGGCGVSCTAPSFGSAMCVAGSCVQTCPVGTTLCSGMCVDTTSDRLNCGACGAKCTGPCVSSACTTAFGLTFVTGTAPTAISADSGNIYWVDPGDGTVNTASEVDIPTVVPLATGQARPTDIAIDDAYVYWSNNLGGAVMRIPKAGGTPMLVSAATEPQHVALDDFYLYWNDSTGIWRAPKAGGTAVAIAASGFLASDVTSLGVDASNVYYGFTYGGYAIFSAPKDGSGIGTPYNSLRCPPTEIVVDVLDPNVWFRDSFGTCGYDGVLYRGGSGYVRTSPVSMASDARFVYASGRQTSSIFFWTVRVPKCGNLIQQTVAEDPVSGDTYLGDFLAVSDRYLYWTRSGVATIRRTPK